MDSIFFVVAHPDDVAAGMGGTALCLKEKYDLHVLCGTKGERGCKEWSMEKTARVREEEELDACRLINADLQFLGRVDREVYADHEICEKVAAYISQIDPVAVFTLWPVDHHPDHSAVAEIARKAVSIADMPLDIVYCEESDHQTRHFTPEVYVDISQVIEQKLEMIRCHKSQNEGDDLAQRFLQKATDRGIEKGCGYAEGFVVDTAGNSERAHVLEIMNAESGSG